MQLELMNKFGIEQAVVFWGGRSDNESVLKAAKAHPGRFIPFVSISPERRTYRPLWESGDSKALQILEGYLRTGEFRGIGEISVSHFPARGFPEADFNPTSDLMRGIMRLAAQHKVPVMIHCEITRLREFSALLKQFPEVPVIWAHGGYTPYFLARRMMEEHPNLYYELSARTWPGHPRSPDYTILQDGARVWREWLGLVEEMPGRFLVGTDASHHSRDSEEGKAQSVHRFLAQLSPGAREKVGRQNLLDIVGRR